MENKIWQYLGANKSRLSIFPYECYVVETQPGIFDPSFEVHPAYDVIVDLKDIPRFWERTGFRYTYLGKPSTTQAAARRIVTLGVRMHSVLIESYLTKMRQKLAELGQ
jgi:hypothetical protein